MLSAYIHGEGRIGVLLQAKTSSNSEVVKTLAKMMYVCKLRQ